MPESTSLAPASRERFTSILRAQLQNLMSEWALMFRPRNILSDSLSSIAVALVAIPLSLAIANASGVDPFIGLVTAVVGGIVAALFGGCRLQVSGPAAAMTFLVFEVVTKYGMDGLITGVLLAGIFQILSGFLRVGRFMQFIPRPVIAGFLTGIGVTILCSQLPKVLGYDVTHDEEGGAFGLLWQTLQLIRETKVTSVAVGATAIGLMLLVPRISRRLPTPLIAVLTASLLPWIFGWTDIAFLGEIPRGFTTPSFPRIPWDQWNELFMVGLTIYFIASIESLLSAAVVDSMERGARVDNDQELVGQGLANVASALFGGIPVTGVIARSATNVQAGARTRLSAILHALIILAMMLAFGPLVARIPIAALAGILIAVSFRMMEVQVLKALWHGSRIEAAVYLATAGTIVMTDLIVGVPVGLVAAFTYFVFEMSRLNVEAVTIAEPSAGPNAAAENCTAVLVVRVEGPLFFASTFHLRNMADGLRGYRCVIFDLGSVPFLDITGAESLEESIEQLQSHQIEVLIARPSPSVRRRLARLTQTELRALRACTVYDALGDAYLHAAAVVQTSDLCGSCRETGQCRQLVLALEGVATQNRTSVPHVRAVIAPPSGDAPWTVEDTRAASDHDRAVPLVTPDSIRPGSAFSALRQAALVDPSAHIDPQATLIGEVTVGPGVFIGPGVSIRADNNAPFHIGAGCSLQEGVTLHAPRAKVVLVQGRPYGLYLGHDVTLTHQALVHGPSYIGDHCFVGFKAVVHDAVLGEGCVVGLGAIVVGVSVPPRRYIPHGLLVDTQAKADALPPVEDGWEPDRGETTTLNLEATQPSEK